MVFTAALRVRLTVVTTFSGSWELLCPSDCGNGDGCERKERRNRRTEKMTRLPLIDGLIMVW